MDDNARSITCHLVSSGYEAYFVGGAVRDTLMGRPFHDIDIATNATPTQVVSLFERICKVVPTGIEHGTVTLVLNDKQYEVTTYRKDVETDGRHAEVEFAKTLQEDLSRRDFTVNAMAMDLNNNIVDPFNGRGDILDKTIRAVGPAQLRMDEDYLRMLRAVRFSASLGFSVDNELLTAIIGSSERITHMSTERQRDELMKMMSADNVLQALNLLKHTGLLGHIMPELVPTFEFPQNKYHTHDVFTHMAIACDAIPKEKPLLRFTALVHDIGKPATCVGKGTPDASFHSHEHVGADIVAQLMRRMTFSSAETERVVNLVHHHMFQYSGKMTDGAIRRLVRSLGLENVQDLIEVKWSDRIGKGPQHFTPYNPNTSLRLHVDRLVAEASAFGIKDLKVNGKDLMQELNLCQGPTIGKVLNQLLEKVLDNAELNEKSKLLELARSIIPPHGQM